MFFLYSTNGHCQAMMAYPLSFEPTMKPNLEPGFGHLPILEALGPKGDISTPCPCRTYSPLAPTVLSSK
jgi:hypothetical protein